jgi:hypothetical protein
MAQINVLKNVRSVAKQCLAAPNAYDITSRAGLRNPANANSLVLEEFGAKDGKTYMAMTREWSSEMFMDMKAAPDMSVMMVKALKDQI